jgi:hypothetical protein
MTKRDLASDNQDLRSFCGGLLASLPRTSFSVVPAGGDAVMVTSAGLDRLDLTVEGRPAASVELGDGTTEVEVPAGWSVLDLAAFDGDLLRQRRRLRH